MKIKLMSAAVASLSLFAPVSQAAPYSFSGQFLSDDDVVSFDLKMAGSGDFSVRTLGWGGGVNAVGQSISGGGFAPVVSLFDNSGALIHLIVGSSNVCGSNSGAVDKNTGACWDAVFTVTLPAGLYTLALSQDGDVPYGPFMVDGFSRAGEKTYTGLDYLGLASKFVNVDGSQRSGDWALDINARGLSVIKSVPEPTTLSLCFSALVFGLGALVAKTNRKEI